MAEELKKDEKPKVKKKLDIKTLHKTLLADTKFIEKLKGERQQCVLSMKSKKDAEDIKPQAELDTKKKESKK